MGTKESKRDMGMDKRFTGQNAIPDLSFPLPHVEAIDIQVLQALVSPAKPKFVQKHRTPHHQPVWLFTNNK